MLLDKFPSRSRFYNYYVSLGIDCEVAYQIRRALGRDDSSFFSWNVTHFGNAISLIGSKFENVMVPENFRYHADGGLVYDYENDYFFHSDFPFHSPGLNFFDYPDTIKQHQKKARHLTEKFIETARSDATCVYFYKTAEARVRDKALRLAEKIAALSNTAAPFTLVILQTRDREEPDWGIPCIANRYLRRFTPVDDATDAHVFSWDAIFREFPHVDKMQLANY